MQIKRTTTSDTKVTITVSAKADELQAIKDIVLTKLTDAVKVPGFRSGKTPPAMVEKHIDSATLQSEFLEEAINQLYVQAAQSEKLRPVASPEISLKKFVPFTDLEFEAVVEVLGEIKLPDYKKIKKTKPSVTVAAKDVNEVLNNLLTRNAERKDVNRAAKENDQVWIDFQGVDTKTKQPISGADGTDYPLVLGSNSFIPGFEPELIGLKGGDEKTFTITFPKDYGVQALGGKQVTFTVSVTKVQEIVPPALDDDFAKANGPFQTLKELKEDIKKQLNVERERQAERDLEVEIIQEIAAKSKVAVPEKLIEEQVTHLEREERQNLTYRGQTWEEHLKEEGVTADEHRAQKRPAAEQQVKISLVLSALAEAEDMNVTPEELEAQIETLRAQYADPAMRAELDKPENRQDITNRILTDKTIKQVAARATAK